MNAVDWKPVEPKTDVDGNLPHVTHEGELNFAGAYFRVYQLSDGQRVLDADDVETFFSDGAA